MNHQPDTGGFRADTWRRVLLGCVIAVTVILVGWMLRATASLFIPIVFSVFLALLVAPVDRWGTRHAPKRASWLGHVAAMGTILLVLLVFIGSIWYAAQQVLELMPEDADQLEAAIPLAGPAPSEGPAQPGGAVLPGGSGGEGQGDGGQGSDGQGNGSGFLDRIASFFSSAGGSITGRIADWAAGYASTIVGAAGAVLGGTVLVFFLTLLMLIEGPRWRDKLLFLVGPSRDGVPMKAVDEIAERLRKYLWARTIMGVLTALLYMGWLWIFGLDLLFVWGLLALVLNYIPTLGSLIAGVAPVVYAFATRDLGTAALIAGGLFAIEQVMGNYVDPRVQGRQVSISPLVVLVVLLLWGWIWGVAGAILAVPITIALLIVSAHVPQMRPLAVLLSNETDESGLERTIDG